MADDDLSPFNLNEINLANYDLGEELGTGKYPNPTKNHRSLPAQPFQHLS